MEMRGELLLGLLEDKAVRSKASWSGVNVRSGPCVVPFMIILEYQLQPTLQTDKLRCLEIAADRWRMLGRNGWSLRSLRSQDQDPREKLITDPKYV